MVVLSYTAVRFAASTSFSDLPWSRSVFARAMTSTSMAGEGGQFFDEVDRIEHSLDRAAIGLIRERIAEVAVEILDIDHIGLSEAHDGVAGGVGRHHRDEVHRFAVHVDR